MSMDMRAQNQALRAAMDRLLGANAELTDKAQRAGRARGRRAAARARARAARCAWSGAPPLKPLQDSRFVGSGADSKCWLAVDYGARFATWLGRRALATRAVVKHAPSLPKLHELGQTRVAGS